MLEWLRLQRELLFVILRLNMKIIVGLGNPGSEYAQTRHNAGFLWLDEVQKRLDSSAWQAQKKFKAEISKHPAYLLVKPQTFMNLSGQAVRAVVSFYQLNPATDLWVAFDDLDLAVGTSKIQLGRGPHAHNGLESIYQELGTKDFTHLRIGIDGRAGLRAQAGKDYVLGKFTPTEKELLQQCFFELMNKIAK